MMNAGNLKGKTRQTSDWRRRMIAFVSALTLLISSCGLTAFAESDEDIYSDPVTAPIPAANTSPEPEEGKAEATPAPEGQPEEGTEPQEATGEETETEGEPEVSEEPEDLTVYEPGSLTAEADGVGITVDYTAEARVPEGAVLTLTRAAGGDLYSALKSASKVLKTEENATWKRELGEDAVFYAITLTDSEGNEVHPETGVTLTCTNLEIPANATGFVTGENAENLDWKDTLTVGFLPDAIGYAYLKQVQIGTVTLTHEDRDYMVTAAYGPDAGFPAGTELKVREILPGTPEYALYSGMTDEALNEDWAEITLERYFDIAFVANGEELEPKADVDVQIVFRDKIEQNEETEVAAVHIENNEANVIEAETDSTKTARHDDEAIDTVTFTSDSFSVYGVVQKKKIITKVLAADGNTYEIEISYTQEAEIPEESQVKVEEIPEGSDLWEAYRKQTAAALNADDVRLPGLYDISIIDAEGARIEPKAPVSVSIKLANAEANNEDLHVVHFTEEIPQELVEAEAKSEEQTEVQPIAEEDKIESEKITASVEGDTVTFDTKGFSVYAFAYTIITYYKTATGETYKITLNYDENSGIPAGSTLNVEEILPGDSRYNEYLEKAIKAAGQTTEAAEIQAEDAATEEETNASEESAVTEETTETTIPENQYARFFDIEIRNNDQKIEPTGKVSVTFELADVPEDKLDNLRVIHFSENETTVLSAETKSEAISFDTDSFSVYGVIAFEPSQGVTDLAGRSFTIKNGEYVSTEIGYSGTTDLFLKKSSETVWYFEGTAVENQYNIYTMINGTKQYMRLNRRDSNRAHAALNSAPQAFTVIKNGNGTYSFRTTSNGTNYYLNAFSNTNGFAGWYTKSAPNDEFNLEFKDPIVSAGEHYAVIVKDQGGDTYYAVKNDGTLQQVEYDPDTNTVTLEYPLFWEYKEEVIDGGTYHTLRIPTQASGFDGNNLPKGYYYRYIDPTERNSALAKGKAISEEPIIPVIGDNDDHTAEANAAHPDYAKNCAIVYENNRIYGYWGRYLGIDEANLTLLPRASSGSAAEVYLVKAKNVLPSANLNHTVNHIDISIKGGASLDVILKGGTYYYRDTNNNLRPLTASESQPIELELKTDNIDIEPDDMKHAVISAYTKEKGVLDDAYYITGYSQNRHNDISTNQIRLEGSFKVADINPYYWTKEDDLNYWQLQARKNNRVYYSVTVSKEVTFNWEYSVNGRVVPLLDAEGKQLSSTVMVNLSKSFDYWDEQNECPPVTWNRGTWREGHIIWNTSEHNGSGMDFKLEAPTTIIEQDKVAIEITKEILTVDGEVLHPNTTITNQFIVYQKTENYSNDIDSVANIGMESRINTFNYEDAGYNGLHVKPISISGNAVSGMVRDYDVVEGMVYIEEDDDSIAKVITDTSGNKWKYSNTYVETDYVDRDTSYTGKEHKVDGLKAVPEVLGAYGNGKTNKLQKFHVYNIYTPVTTLTVNKVWDDQDDPTDHTDDSVTLKLYRYTNGIKYKVSGAIDDQSGVDTSILSADEYVKDIVLYNGHWTETVEDIAICDPNGYLYYYKIVEENVPTKYKVTYSSSGIAANVPEVSLTATNTKDDKKGDLKVSKTVIGTEGDKNLEFEFKVTLVGHTSTDTFATVKEKNGVNPEDGSITFDGDSETFTLKDGERLTIKDLPENTQYKVEEKTVLGYKTTINGIIGTIATGTIANNETAVVGYTNEKVNDGSLKITKLVDGSATEEDRQKLFNFTIEILNEDNSKDTSFSGLHGDLEFTEGSAPAELKDNGYVVVTNLPYNTKYRISETCEDDNLFIQSVKVNGGESQSMPLTDQITSSAQIEVIVTNTRKETINIEASKAYTTDTEDADKPTAVQFTLLRKASDSNDYDVIEVVTVTANDSWKHEWKNLEKKNEDGTTEYSYYVVETGLYFGNLSDEPISDDDWVQASISRVSEGTLSYDSDKNAWTITIRNTSKTDVPVIKNWADFDNAQYDWYAKFQLYKKEELVYGDADTSDAAIEWQKMDEKELVVRKANALNSKFEKLDIYSKHDNGNVYKVTYKVEETEYKVWTGTPPNETVIAQWDKDGKLEHIEYKDKDYSPYYEQEIAGENTLTTNLNDRYTIRVNNKAEENYDGKLVVHKQWLGVLPEDLKDYPAVYVTLYRLKPGQTEKRLAEVYTADDDVQYVRHELNYGNNWTWIIENLPSDYSYFVVEEPIPEKAVSYLHNGAQIPLGTIIQTDNDVCNTNPLFYIELDSYQSRSTFGTGEWSSAYGYDNPHMVRTGNTGEILIKNKCPNKYMQIDIKKKILKYLNGNELWTLTSSPANMRDLVMLIQIYRRIVRADEHFSINNYTYTSDTPPLTDFEPYGKPMLIGYEHDGTPVAINPNDPDLFTIRRDGSEGPWHWTISNTSQNQGLPRNGFYTKDNIKYPVRYQYLVVELNAYTDSTMTTPLNYLAVTPAAWDGSGEGTGCQFYVTEPTIAQDQDRLVNRPAAKLVIEKKWNVIQANKFKVYVKVSRSANGDSYDERYIENLADHLNKTFDPWLLENGFIEGKANYTTAKVEEVNGVKCFVLEGNETIEILNVEVGSIQNPKGQYHYWVEEMGYRDEFGTLHWFAGQSAETSTASYSVTPAYGGQENTTKLMNHNGKLNNASNDMYLGETGENKFTITNTIPTTKKAPTVNKMLNGVDFTGKDSALNDIAFTFTLTQENVPSGQTAYTDSATSAADGTITFEDIEFTAAGTYIYEIVENGTDDDTMDYDEHKIYAKVVITKSGNDLIASEPEYYKKYIDGVCSEKIGSATFNNTELGKLDLKKLVVPNTGITLPENASETKFVFKIVLTAPENGTLPESVSVAIDNDNADDYTVSETDGEYSITVELTKDQTAHISNLPVGTKYTITETNVPGYTLTWTENKGASGTISKTVSEAEATNTFNSVEYTPVAKKMLNGTEFKGKLGDGTTTESFTFDLKEMTVSGEAGSETYTVSEKALQSKTTSDEGSISFDALKYNVPGTYYYQITEQKTNSPTMDCDETPVYLKVVVDDELNVEAGYYTNQACTDSAGNEATFHNTELTEVDVTKKWMNHLGAITPPPEGTKIALTLYKGTEDDASAVGAAITLDGTADTVVDQTAYEYEAWKAKWTKLPKYEDGVLITYVVKETTGAEGYTVSYQGTDATYALNNEIITNTLNEIDIDILKVNDKDEPLIGAEFKLEKLTGEVTGDNDGYTVVSQYERITINSSDGKERITGLTDGTYRLTETKAPAGYILLSSPLTFVVKDGAIESDNRDETTFIYTPKNDSAPDTYKITNTPGAELPATGGSGTLIYTITGIFLITLAGTLLAARKRKANR